MTKIIDGKEISKIIRSEQKVKVELLKKNTGITPGLAVVLVGKILPARHMLDQKDVHVKIWVYFPVIIISRRI